MEWIWKKFWKGWYRSYYRNRIPIFVFNVSPTPKKKRVTHDHEGLTVLRKLQKQGEVTGIKSSSGVVTSHLFAVGCVRRDTGNPLGYIFH